MNYFYKCKLTILRYFYYYFLIIITDSLNITTGSWKAGVRTLIINRVEVCSGVVLCGVEVHRNFNFQFLT